MKYIKEHKKIGEWLRAKRELAGLSQAQLAAVIGNTKSFVGRYEAGQRLDIIMFTKIALALNAKPCEAFESCIEGNRKT
jgi:transcriptional regulator with XRE-family HTH domain